jgi:hypothetical protein
MGVDHAIFEFSCGGDSMNETQLNFYDKDGKRIDLEQDPDNLSGAVDNEVYENVTFYECSDGHYLGESGDVYISMGGDGVLEYTKSATSEFSEWVTEKVDIIINEDVRGRILRVVENISGDTHGHWDINYKEDCILDDDDIDAINSFVKFIQEESVEYDIELAYDMNIVEESEDENFQFDSSEQSDEGFLSVKFNKNFYLSKDQ